MKRGLSESNLNRGGGGRCLHTDSLFSGTKTNRIYIVILFGFNSSQRFLKSPCDCASSWAWVPGEALLALERLCAACTPVEGMNRGGGWAAELQTDWRHQQNRGHAWSTTQNKPGQTTSTRLLRLPSRADDRRLGAAEAPEEDSGCL